MPEILSLHPISRKTTEALGEKPYFQTLWKNFTSVHSVKGRVMRISHLGRKTKWLKQEGAYTTPILEGNTKIGSRSRSSLGKIS